MWHKNHLQCSQKYLSLYINIKNKYKYKNTNIKNHVKNISDAHTNIINNNKYNKNQRCR